MHNKRIQDKENVLYLHNGANNHMYVEDKFLEFNELIRGHDTFSNHSKVF